MSLPTIAELEAELAQAVDARNAVLDLLKNDLTTSEFAQAAAAYADASVRVRSLERRLDNLVKWTRDQEKGIKR